MRIKKNKSHVESSVVRGTCRGKAEDLMSMIGLKNQITGQIVFTA